MKWWPLLLNGTYLLIGQSLIAAADDQPQRPSQTSERFFDGKLGRVSDDGGPGQVVTPAAAAERLPDRLRVGDPAPDFTLPGVAARKEVTLSGFRGHRPVVLIFASYT